MADSWLKEVCETYMDFSGGDWEACMQDQRKKATNGAAVDDFLGPHVNRGTSLFIGVTFISEKKQIKVKRSRQVPVETLSASSGAEVAPDDGAAISAHDVGAAAVTNGTTDGTMASSAISSESATAMQESKEKEAAELHSASDTPSAPNAETKQHTEPTSQTSEQLNAPEAAVMRTIEEEVIETQTVLRRVLVASLGALPAGLTEAATAAANEGRTGPAAVYFIKSVDGALSPTDSSPDGVADYMAEAVEAGTLSPTDLLGSVEGLLAQVYTPYFEPLLSIAGGVPKDLGLDDGGFTVADEGDASTQGGRGRGAQSVAGKSHGGGGRQGPGSDDGDSEAAPRVLVTGFAPDRTGRSVSPERGGKAGAATTRRSNVLPLPIDEDKGITRIPDSVKGDFRGALARFTSSLAHARTQMSGDVRIHVPACSELCQSDPAAAVQDETVKAELLECLEAWGRIIAETLVQGVTEEDKGTRALQELEFWRGRSAKLTTLHDALSQASVRACIGVLETAKEPAVELFKTVSAELGKAVIEARDNVKFLSTLERHFKTISAGSLSAMQETIPSLLNGLRMVWIVSRTYNTEETMLPLLTRIANELADRVESDLSIKGVLRLAKQNPSEALGILQQGQELLESWRTVYLTVRERIERATDRRWEFDRRILFDRTDHIATVIADLRHVVETSSQLSRFFRGNELKAVANDPQDLAAITRRVDRLVVPISKLLYNAYDKNRMSKWRVEMSSFDRAVGEIESRTEAFIARAFGQLRSAEGAADLLQKFRSMDANMRASLRALLENNTPNIVARARRELSVVSSAFEAGKANPPVYKNNPPVAGAIAWANAVYQKQKKPILKLRSLPGLFEAAGGSELKAEYIAFARSVDTYIKTLHSGWCEAVTRSTGDLLRQPIIGPGLLKDPMTPKQILARMPRPALAGVEGAEAHSRLKAMLTAAAAAAAATAQTAALQGDKDAMRMPPPPFTVNFSPSLRTVVRESRLLDRMGFPVPEVGMNVALQEDKLNDYVARLGSMLQTYHATIAGLSPIECNLLQVQLAKLRAALRPGFMPLNWNSLHIDAYIGEVTKALQDFEGVLQQVRKSIAMLVDAETAIGTTSLITASDFLGRTLPMDVSDLYDAVEKARATRLEGLVYRYRSTKAVMQQIEGFISGTDTCASPALAELYRYWERRFYNAITRMTLTSMATFQALLNAATLPASAHAQVAAAHGGSMPRFPPLVRVKATYSNPDVILSPDLAQVGKYLRRSVYALIKSAKSFTRWMDGTCLEASVTVPAGEAAPDFSYFEDIRQNPEIVALLMTLNPAVIRVFNAVKAATSHWGRYGASYNLWAPRKPDAEKRMIDKAPPATFFDTRLAAYGRLADGVDSLPAVRDVGFLRLDCQPIAASIKAQACKLKGDFGHALVEIATKKLQEFNARIADMRAAINAVPTDLESLKAVLTAVAGALDNKVEMEVQASDISERFHTVTLHGIEVEAALVGQASTAMDAWRATVDLALTRDARLVKVKEQFRSVTQSDVTTFVSEADALRKEFLASGPTSAGITLVAGLAALYSFRQKLADANKKREGFSQAERLFDLPLTRYQQLADMKEDMDRVSPLYEVYAEQQAFAETNANTLWDALDISALQRGAEDLVKRLSKLKDLKGSAIYQLVFDEVNGFKDSLPLIASLKNPAMKERHWDKIGEITGTKIAFNPKTFTLGGIFAMKLERFSEGVDEVVNEAKQEGKIEKDLKTIIDKWTAIQFSVIKYIKNGEARGFVLKPSEELKLDLDDSLLNLQAMAGSRFVGIFAATVSEWEKKLNMVSEVQDVWFVVQTKWAYLEGIFVGSEDIKAQLPEEAKRFGAIDKDFKGIMTATAKVPNVVDACCEPGRLELLQKLGERLDACQKSLSEYLNTKRNAFARFFFISDDELLSVLGSSDPSSIRVHLLKLFDNVKDFTFGRGGRAITNMASSEGEGFTLREPSPVEGAVEVWMTQAEAAMRSSLQLISKEGVFGYAHAPRLDWIADQLGMVVCAGSQIWWTWETEDVFRRVRKGDKYAMKAYAERQTKQLLELVARVRDNIPKLLRIKVNTLLIVDVHARDIIDSFVRDSILDAREFAWESQLRFYWNKDVDDIVISQCTGNFRYGYEYMGLNGRLVITPLTDRCYMTLTQALTFNLGGAPAGPAGTGKTETTKDLAKNLAIPCFVINCGEGLDYKAMGSTFSGLCQVGAWGCFDEFNRINIEVLSVVSAQVRAIQNALNYKRFVADIGFGDIKVSQKVGIFITMNPGYAGRTELPDNLKAMFRPVTMIVPDLLQICEIMLFSEGFEGARGLAKKMTTLYKLSKEQLSKQYHYDFGLRALKSVLVMAGSLKREFSSMAEDLVLMRSLRDNNLPKFVYDDVPLFLGLIADLFPGLDCPRVAYPTLNTAIETELEKADMRHEEETVFQAQVDKVVQLYEIMLTRHTTMMVGPTGGGKTVCLVTLQKASLPSLDKNVKIFTVNPKAQTVNELYGVMDPQTRDWNDGVLSKLFRSANEPLPAGKENEMRWIVLDGDVDAVWVENMNSVMDDNKLLTLPNGERIRLQVHCKLIIEVYDLQYASPATVSRVGMMYVDPKNLGYRPYYSRWVRQRCVPTGRATEKDNLWYLFDKYVPRLIDYVLEGDNGKRDDKGAQTPESIEEPLFLVVPQSNLQLTKQLCNVLDSLLTAETEYDSMDVLEGLFIHAVTWSLGASVLGKDRARFNALLQQLTEGSANPKGMFYDCYYDPNTQKWVEWSAVVPSYEPPLPWEFAKVLVPTTDSVLYTTLLQRLVAVDKTVMFVGESGTAKTTTIANYLAKLEPEKYGVLNVNFSSRTASRDVQNVIESAVDKRSGKTFGPPVGKKLAVFIDDLSMPKVDKYGTQQPIALLHFLVGRGHMYDRGKELDLRTFKDLLYMSAMSPPGGGRNSVDPRFVALFSVFNLVEPTVDVLTKIYGSILTRYFGDRPFADPIKDVAAKITPATLAFFAQVVEKMPPTPAKFHYIFNLRDLGRAYEGVCNAVPEIVSTGPQLVRLWRNEVQRIFCDRLITEADAVTVNALLADQIKRAFSDASEVALADPCIFGDFSAAVGRIVDEKEDPRQYKDLGGYPQIRTVLDQVLAAYNEERKPMTLVLFEQALEHLTRILRILRQPRGHALLVGVGGSGKQSLTKLAGFCAGYKHFEITLLRNYGETEFREDLKSLFKLLLTGPVVFLFTDAHVIEEGFLELLNNMLTTGMVPALYENDEKEAIINSVRKAVKEAGMVDTKDACWGFFIAKCRANLHMVLAMSPSGDNLRRRCRNFPGLVSSTVIDWFHPWPADALRTVAEFFLRDETLPEDCRGAVTEHMVHVHTSVVRASNKFELELRRHNYVTPKNYLDFISNYRSQLNSQRKGVTTRSKRLEGGLTKLVEAASAVDVMSIELKEQKVVVDAKTVDVQALIRDIGERQAIADRQQADAQVKAKELAESAVIITEESAKANTALEAALPALEMAAQALDNLDKKDIDEVKVMAKPPALVMMVGMCVMALRPLGKEDDSQGWTGAKIMMSDSNFLKALKTYNKDGITGKMMAKVLAFFKEPDFTIEKVRSASKAGAGLLQWVIAIKEYYAVAKDVEPLRKKVSDMEKQQAQGEKELADINELLGKLSAELSDLDVKYKAASAELQDLSERAALMEKRLTAASKLITGLSSERSRWSGDIEKLNSKLHRLVGDCLLASSFLSYLGPFTFQYRQQLLQENWLADVTGRKIPCTSAFVLEELMVTEATIQKWAAEGLPADQQSVYNGILTTRASRFPLCIDPQQQAVQWIKNREGAELKVASLMDGDFMQPLKLAIQYGKPFLFEAVDETLDPMIDPILEQNTFMDGSQRMITLDDKAIPWDDNFRLYLTSKLANPHYSPEVMGKVMVINYGVTVAGLENQLLNVVVGFERPDLEKQFKDLVDDMGANAVLLEELEESLLRNLAASSGNILDNEELISTLEEAKSKSVEISAKLAQSQLTKSDINKTRDGYAPAAKRGSILFFAVAGLSNINSMYETSLASFLVVFRRSLAQAKKGSTLDIRLRNMVQSMTAEVYNYTCTGIFERHKLMFSFQMTTMILDGDGQLNRAELDFFLKGDTSLEGPKEACPASWIQPAGWKDLLKLCSPEIAAAFHQPALEELLPHVKGNAAEWRAWYDLESPEMEALPGGFSDKLSPMQRLLVYRCFRPDRVYNGVKRYVMEIMGEYYVQPPVLDYPRIWSQSTPATPVVFILSPGADPQSDIQALGMSMGFPPPTKFKFLALGQGQAPKAEEMIEQGAARGYWVLLQNTHLLISWLKTLEKILANLASGGADGKSKVHPDFRLWMTTDPTDRFPLGILQRSIKVVTEPPDGLKLNTRAMLAKIGQESLEECTHPAYRPLVYALTFLHATLLERRKFGKIGFNVAYDFNESDYNISRKLIGLYLSKAVTNQDDMIPWGSLKYLVGDAMYGGRVSDAFDRRILSTYLEEYMGDFLFADEGVDALGPAVGVVPGFSPAPGSSAQAEGKEVDNSKRFAFSRSGPGDFEYVLPPWGQMDTYAKQVESLPLVNGPAVYGLHANAEIGYFTAGTKSLWAALIDLQPRTATSGTGMSREEVIASTVRDLQSRIPEPEDVFNIRKRFSADGGVPSPTQIVLLQELERWNILVTSMSSSLVDLGRALNGEIGMSETLEELGTSLFNGKLPQSWRTMCPDTQKPLGAWMSHFAARLAQYRAWIEHGEPKVMWLSGLHIPDSYLMALIQSTCRRKGWALDRSTLYTQVTKYITDDDVPAPPEDGCYVRGLYLEGAGWDREHSCLVKQEPKVLVTELPILQVLPIEASRLKLAGTFRTPVYVTQMRRNAMGVGLVFEGDLTTTTHPSHWVLQGVCLCLNTDA